MRKIAVFCAGGFGREVALMIGQINLRDPAWELIGFFDDAPALQGKEVDGIRVLGGLKELNRAGEELAVVIAAGSPRIKREIAGSIDNPRIVFPSLIHPGVIYPGDTQLGKGCVICAGSILTVNVRLGDFVTVNLACTIGHDTTVGAFSSLMPGVCVSGEAALGEGVYIGTGANILNGIGIGGGSVIGGGALVNKSLPGRCTAVGVPVRVIRYEYSGG